MPAWKQTKEMQNKILFPNQQCISYKVFHKDIRYLNSLLWVKYSRNLRQNQEFLLGEFYMKMYLIIPSHPVRFFSFCWGCCCYSFTGIVKTYSLSSSDKYANTVRICKIPLALYMIERESKASFLNTTSSSESYLKLN